MNKKMMLLPFLFLILMAVPMVDASEGNETDVIILPPPPPPPPLPITNETDPVIIVTDQDLASIQLRLDSIYVWMKTRDELMMNSRSDIRELDTEVVALMSSTHVLFDEAFSYCLELQDEIDTQSTYIEDLRQEIEQVSRELETERANRNVLTLMFGVFCLVVIGATVVINKK